MIKKITILGPACYKQTATLETDKNINLIYGLNGSVNVSYKHLRAH